MSDIIAIVGMGCLFPGGITTPREYWTNLCHGTISIVPPSENRIRLFNGGNLGRVTAGGFLDGVSVFDPEPFGIGDREASIMDPQHRILLQTAWSLFEDAGYDPRELGTERCGVFLGLASNDYQELILQDPELESIDCFAATGNSRSGACGRIAQVFGLSGPTFTVDSACSSSLLATHLACQSLRLQECDMAIAGGAQLVLSSAATVALNRLRVLSPKGLSLPFDNRADGYVRGEGTGLVLLKRLEDAIEGKDRIYATILGSAVNHSVTTDRLITPDSNAQSELMSQVLEKAGIKPSSVGYLEAHATGTKAGDRAEALAIGHSFCAERNAETPLFVGSVKSSLGHLEAAAGVAGLIKSVLAVSHQIIPPTPGITEPIYEVTSPNLQLCVKKTYWPDSYDSPIGGINSFGFTGTNVHILIKGVKRQKSHHNSASNKFIGRHYWFTDTGPLSFSESCKAITQKRAPVESNQSDDEDEVVRENCSVRIVTDQINGDEISFHIHREGHACLYWNDLAILSLEQSVFLVTEAARQLLGWSPKSIEHWVTHQFITLQEELQEVQVQFSNVEQNTATAVIYRPNTFLDPPRDDLELIATCEVNRLQNWDRECKLQELSTVMHSPEKSVSLRHFLKRLSECDLHIHWFPSTSYIQLSDFCAWCHLTPTNNIGSINVNGTASQFFDFACQLVPATIPPSIARRSTWYPYSFTELRFEAEAPVQILSGQLAPCSKGGMQQIEGTVVGYTDEKHLSFSLHGLKYAPSETIGKRPSMYSSFMQQVWSRSGMTRTANDAMTTECLSEHSWVVLEDGTPLSHKLKRQILRSGQNHKFLEPNENLLKSPEFFLKQLEDEFQRLGQAPVKMLILWPRMCANGVTPIEVEHATRLLSALYELMRRVLDGNARPQIIICTTGGQQVLDEQRSPLQSLWWGLGRSLQRELHPLLTRLIDLDPSQDDESLLNDLFSELTMFEDAQVAFREGVRFVPRLRTISELMDAELNDTMKGTQKGIAVRWQTEPTQCEYEAYDRDVPIQDDIEVKVTHASFCKDDLRLILERNPDRETTPFHICAGQVIRVGPACQEFQVGEDVATYLQQDLRSHIIVPATSAIHIGDRRPSDIVSLGVGFIAAYELLSKQTELNPIRRIFVHGAGTEIGRWIVLYALRKGIQVHCTAGGVKRCNELRARGVANTINIRDTMFRDTLSDTLQAEQFDRVINALSPEAAGAHEVSATGLSSFIQIQPVAGPPFPGSYNVREKKRRKTHTVREALKALSLDMNSYQESDPSEFPFGHLQEAFRFLLQSDSSQGASIQFQAPKSNNKIDVRPDGTFVITGGLGHVGLMVARWLAERGAGQLVLLGRRPPGPKQKNYIESISSLVNSIKHFEVDVSNREALRKTLNEVKHLGPIRGVIHAAGVLKDAAVARINHETLMRVLAPKVLGASHLHYLIGDSDDLDFFLLFSSIAAPFGSAGQSHYAAANEFLEGLASYRRSLGLPANCIHWGPWAFGGMTSQLTAKHIKRVTEQGIRLLENQDAEQLLDAVFRINCTSCIALLGDSQRRTGFGAKSRKTPNANRVIGTQVGQTKPSLEAIRDFIAVFIGASVDYLADSRPLKDLEFDSLMAVDLIQHVEQHFGIAIELSTVFNATTIGELLQACRGKTSE